MMTYYVPRNRRALYRALESNRPEVHIPVDVIVEGDDYILSAYVPGIAPEAIEIEVLDDTVSISGEFSAIEGEETHYLLRERPTGRFSRSLRLPKALDPAKAKAEVKDGVLTLRVSQAEHAKARQIAVKAK